MAFGHGTRDLDMVVHGDDFIVAGCGKDFDWLSQKLSEQVELVQISGLGPGYDGEATVLNRCVTYLGSWPTTRRTSSDGAWTSGGASTHEPRRRHAERTTGPRGTGA